MAKRNLLSDLTSSSLTLKKVKTTGINDPKVGVSCQVPKYKFCFVCKEEDENILIFTDLDKEILDNLQIIGNLEGFGACQSCGKVLKELSQLKIDKKKIEKRIDELNICLKAVYKIGRKGCENQSFGVASNSVKVDQFSNDAADKTIKAVKGCKQIIGHENKEEVAEKAKVDRENIKNFGKTNDDKAASEISSESKTGKEPPQMTAKESESETESSTSDSDEDIRRLEPPEEKPLFCFSYINTKYRYKPPRHKIEARRRRFVCSCCPKEYPSKLALNIHFTKRHSENIEQRKGKTKNCDICDKICIGSHGLIRHVELDHLSKREGCPYQCKEGKNTKFGSDSEFEQHLKACEAKKKTEGKKCYFCGEVFSCLLLRLLHHLKSHVTHPCPICQHNFSQRDIMETHLKANHPERRQKFTTK